MEFPNPRYQILRNTQVAIFRESGIAPDDVEGIIKLLSPKIIADRLGLDYIEWDDVQPDSSEFRIAGILDRTNKHIYVSQAFPLDQQRLTAMHEVVHYVVHRDVGVEFMHRDRPINPDAGRLSNPIEVEATHFACLYLMPERLVRRVFASMFMLAVGEAFKFDEHAAFYLNVDIEEMSKMNRRQKALMLSATHTFRRHVVPLHRLFEVSPTAMAIRLEELGLIAPERLRGPPTLRLVK